MTRYLIISLLYVEEETVGHISPVLLIAFHHSIHVFYNTHFILCNIKVKREILKCLFPLCIPTKMNSTAAAFYVLTDLGVVFCAYRMT